MPELPGQNVLAVMLQAPTDILGLATRQVTETLGVFNSGVQRLAVELATPPSLAGLQLPMIPGFGMGAVTPPVSVPAGVGIGIQAGARTQPSGRRNGRGMII